MTDSYKNTSKEQKGSKLSKNLRKVSKESKRKVQLSIMARITVIQVEKKPVKLSFAIQKAPERKKIETAPIDKKPRQKIKKTAEENKTVVIPDKFIKIAKKFGLPEDNLQFFYENRKSFHWESMQKTYIHCFEQTCKFTTKASPKCLVEHMINAHNYADIPCEKPDCNYIAFSRLNLKHHHGQFHGHGVRPTDFGKHPCPYSSCKVFFKFPAHLKAHLDIHENRLFSCSYCQYRTVKPALLQEHLLVHFHLKIFACDVCPSKFVSKLKLEKHKKVVHTNDDFICVDCGFVAKKWRSLRTHRATCEERLKFSRIL
jgi:hypothetical protein